jgi:hypothetical protein
VAYIHDPSYSGGRNQKDQGLKPAREIVQKTLSQKKPITKKNKKPGGVAQTPVLQNKTKTIQH